MTARPVEIRLHWWRIALFGLLVALLALFFSGLGRDGRFIPSPLVGRTAPSFTLAKLAGDGDVTLGEFRGRAVIINFWASWCTSCRVEHDLLVSLGARFAGDDRLAMIGINYKDTKWGANRFLAEQGAFAYPSGIDQDGLVGLDYGVYGLPETFFIDAGGTIVAKHVGPLTEAVVTRELDRLGLVK